MIAAVIRKVFQNDACVKYDIAKAIPDTGDDAVEHANAVAVPAIINIIIKP